MDAQKEKEQDAESVKSAESQRQGGSSYALATIIENLVLTGLVSLAKWDFFLNEMKKHPHVASNPDVFGVYLMLSQIYQFLSTKLYTDLNVCSQDKVPIVQNKTMDLKEVMRLVNPILKKKEFQRQN